MEATFPGRTFEYLLGLKKDKLLCIIKDLDKKCVRQLPSIRLPFQLKVAASR